MPNSPQLSDAKRALLESYLRGDAQRARNLTRSAPILRSGGPVPLSVGQEQLWLAAQLAPGVPIDTEFVTVSIHEPVDIRRLENSFNALIERHEIMRTSIVVSDGRPMQVIQEPGGFSVSVVDLRGVPAQQRAEEAGRLANEHARRPFDLTRAPLFRAILMQLADAEQKLVLVLHHLVFDCVSAYTVFLPELARLYAAGSEPRTDTHPGSAPHQYADYAVWQREQLVSKQAADDLAYWRARLVGAATLQLPTDYPRPAHPSFRGAVEAATIPPDMTDRILALGRQQAVTPFMVLVAAFQSLLHRYSGQDDVVVGTESGTRGRPEFDHLLGFFLNTLVLRSDFSNSPTFRQVLGRIKQGLLEAYSHAAAPFPQVVSELSPRRDTSRHPLFQVMFRLGPRLGGLGLPWTLSPVDLDPGVSKFDLTLDLYDTEHGLICRLEYSTDLFKRDTMVRLLDDLRTVLARVVANPDVPVNELPLIGARYLEPAVVPSAPTIGRTNPAPPRVLPTMPMTAGAREPAGTSLLDDQLTRIWEEVLDTRPVRPHDDFFELGGTSLLAVRMLARVEDVLGQRIPLGVLFVQPTIQHLAEMIMTGIGPALRSPLVQVRRGGAKRPFFFLHGEPSGAGFYARSLATYLDEDRPFYVLQSSGPAGEPPPTSIEAISATLIDAIRARQPHGPYLLGGRCNGGTIAYEMARQLEALGERVDLLMMLHSRTRYSLKLRLGYRALLHAGKLGGFDVEQQVVPYLLYRRIRPQVEELWRQARANNMRTLLESARISFGGVASTRPSARDIRSHARSFVEQCRASDWSAPVFWSCSGYVPKPYSGKVTLLWWTDEPYSRRDPTMGWGRVAREVEIAYVSGSDRTLLQHVEDLGICLQRELSRFS